MMRSTLALSGHFGVASAESLLIQAIDRRTDSCKGSLSKLLVRTAYPCEYKS